MTDGFLLLIDKHRLQKLKDIKTLTCWCCILLWVLEDFVTENCPPTLWNHLNCWTNRDDFWQDSLTFQIGQVNLICQYIHAKLFKIKFYFDTTKILRSHPFRRWIMTRLLLTVMGHTKKRISTYYQNILYLFPPRRMSFLSLQNIFHLFLLDGFHAEFDQDRNQSHRLQRKKDIQKPQNPDNFCQ